MQLCFQLLLSRAARHRILIFFKRMKRSGQIQFNANRTHSVKFTYQRSSKRQLLALCAESEMCISSTSSIETLSPSVLSTDERYSLSSPPLPGTGSAYNGVCQSSLVHSFSFIHPLSLTQFSISLLLGLKI